MRFQNHILGMDNRIPNNSKNHAITPTKKQQFVNLNFFIKYLLKLMSIRLRSTPIDKIGHFGVDSRHVERNIEGMNIFESLWQEEKSFWAFWFTSFSLLCSIKSFVYQWWASSLSRDITLGSSSDTNNNVQLYNY